jgi:hypothetical protein
MLVAKIIAKKGLVDKQDFQRKKVIKKQPNPLLTVRKNGLPGVLFHGPGNRPLRAAGVTP